MIASQLASSLLPVFKNLWVHGSYANIEYLYQINFLHKLVKSGSVLVDMDMNIDFGKSLEVQFLTGNPDPGIIYELLVSKRILISKLIVR